MYLLLIKLTNPIITFIDDKLRSITETITKFF